MQDEPINSRERLLPATSSPRSYNRWLILLILLLLISTIVLAVLFGLEKGKKKTDNVEDLCLTPYCVKAADYLLDSIDETVNPCEDFYHFTCGSWLKNAHIPEDSGVQNIFNLLDTQLDTNIIDLLSTRPPNGTVEPNAIINARNLYDSCMNEAGIETDGVEPILSIVNNELGGWPILQGPTWRTPPNFNLSDLLLKLRKYDDGIIFSVNTATNQQNSSINDIELGQGTLGLQETEYYNNETDITRAYRQFMHDLASELTNDTGAIDTDVIAMYLLEKNISQYHWTEAEQSRRDNETIRTTVGNLPQSFKVDFDFTNFLRQSYLLGNVTLVDTDIVTVSEVAYLVNVTAILDQYPSRVVQNYLIWRFMMNRASSMPRRIRSTREQFDRVFKGTTAESTRAKTCANYVNDNMGFAVSRLYIKKYFDSDARNQSKEIIKNIRSSMDSMLQQATWMDDDSKSKARDKLQAVYENIGYPDYLDSDNTTQLEKMYAEYVFQTSYVNNVLQMQKVKAREAFRTLREPVDHRAWGDLPPTVVNAFYEPSTNAISFPAGILQMPYFNKDAPKYLNYGGIGMVIGHEITHGFDDDGRQYDKDGDRIPWWSNNTINQFNERKQCIIDQYSNYTVEQIHKNLNGEQTQGENIADNGGIKSSFFAYQNWAKENANVDKRLPGLNKYSQEQMFFIGYAHGWCAKFTDAYALNRVLTDVHSLAQFRVLGPLSNFAEFDRVFSCTPGQGNSRINKCAVCPNDKLCHCKRTKYEHLITNDQWQESEKWREDIHTIKDSTKEQAVSLINGIPYVRCDIETDPVIVETILLDIWHIPRPALLMQVTGGHKYFKLRGKMGVNFLDEFVKFVSKSNTWLLTNGINVGIVQLIGQTIRKRKMTKPDGKTIIIGVCNYGSVKNMNDFQRLEHVELLNNSSSSRDQDLKDVSQLRAGQQSLEMNHTYFILLDDGTLQSYNIGDYRTRLAKTISNGRAKQTLSIPIVSVLFEGGEDSVRSIYNDLRRNIPVIIINNTGRIADYLVQWLLRTQEMDLDINWTTPVNINEENDTCITLNKTFKGKESTSLHSDNFQSMESDDSNKFSRNRLRMKFDKYFNSMYDELTQAINGIDSDHPTKIIKSDKLKKVNDEIILMVLYCLQPMVRSKISVFNFNKDEKLSEIILRSICKSVESKIKLKKLNLNKHEDFISNFDYLLELALDWDCINTAKEWIVQDSLDNIYDRKSIFCRALTKQRHKFVHYFIQLGLEIDEIFFHPKLNPFAARNINKENKRYSEFLKILYTEEAI
ncbi:unnamed protein product, partial [Rotaria sordida]